MVVDISNIRGPESIAPDFDLDYGGTDNYFTMRINHAGFITKYPGRRYIEGSKTYVDFLDSDLFSVRKLNDIMEEIGYTAEEKMFYHYRIPNLDLDFGLRALGNDADVLSMLTWVPRYRIINVYVEHGVTRVASYFMSPTSKVVIDELPDDPSPPLNRARPKKKDGGSCSRKLDLNVHLVDPTDGHCDYSQSIIPYEASQITQCSIAEKSQSVQEKDHAEKDQCSIPYDATQNTEYVPIVDKDPIVGVEIDDMDYSHMMDDLEFQIFQENEEYQYMGDEGSSSDQGSSGDEFVRNEEGRGSDDEEGQMRGFKSANEVGGQDNDYVVDPDAVVDDWDVDMRGFISGFDLGETTGQGPTTGQDDDEVDELEVIDNEDFDGLGLDEDLRNRMLRKMRRKKACTSGVVHVRPFAVGQAFHTKKAVQLYMKQHAIESRRDLYFAKNENLRIRVKCKGLVPDDPSGGASTVTKETSKGAKVKKAKDSCPYAIQVSRPTADDKWLVKTVNDEHLCLNTRKVSFCTSRFLANKIINQVDRDPRVPVTALHEELQMDLELSMSKMKVFRAKAIAKEQLFGDFEKQYTMLRDYGLELQQSNPGTTVKLQVGDVADVNSDSRIFKRVYICPGALKLGFKAGGRELLGLDGCFLTGPFPGQILTAVGLDSNNGIYPLAYGVVEAENTESWTWFLECLQDDLDKDSTCNFTFISDRQKGLIPAIAQVFPSAEHRWCLRHIHQNMKLHWRGDDIRDYVWRCASATTIPHFQSEMKEFKEYCAPAHEYLVNIPAEKWARSHFTGRAHSDCLLNNLCEVFNSKLEQGRDKPIITCLEFIRVYLMKRHCIVQGELDKTRGLLTPTANKILESIKREASKYRALFAGSGKYQVTGVMFDQFVVNLNHRTCSCRYWEITGIVCKHAVSAIWEGILNGEKLPEPEYWVHPCYLLETWRAMYINKIEPINGISMWPKSDCPTTLKPPLYRTPIGRPQKKRKKAATEEPDQTRKLSRRHVSVTCAKCKNKGHNSRTCKGQGGPSQVQAGTSQGGSSQTQSQSMQGRGQGRGQGMGRARGRGRGRGNGGGTCAYDIAMGRGNGTGRGEGQATRGRGNAGGRFAGQRGAGRGNGAGRGVGSSKRGRGRWNGAGTCKGKDKVGMGD